MVRTILTPRWLLALLVAVAFAVACVLLGRWQWGRYEDKQLRADTVRTHYGAPAVPFTTVLGSLPLRPTDEWTRVTVTGTYDDAQRLLVRNRVQGGTPGLEVLVPLTVAPGPGSQAAGGVASGPSPRVLVDRGWVPNADTAAALPSVPAAPTGVVTVQGWLRTPEPSLGKDLPEGQLASIAVTDAEARVGGPLLPVYLVLESERTASGAAAPRPAPLDPPDTDLGPNQAYAVQWWLFSVFGFVFYGYRLRVDRQDRADLAAHAAGPAPPGSPPELVAAGDGRRARPRKVRIWDEEDG